MNKTKNKMQKLGALVLIFCLAVYHLLLNPSPVHALDASSTASTILNAVQKKVDDASSSAIRDIVREKVNEQLDTTNKKAKAATGKVKQITDLNIEIISTDNKTSFASVDENTLYFKVTSGKKKEIKFEDLALDDFVVAMGYKNSKDVLETKRLIAYDKAPEDSRSVIQGKVETIGKSLVTISDKEGKTWKIKIAAKTEISSQGETEDINLTDITKNDSVIVVGMETNDTVNATRVHLLK